MATTCSTRPSTLEGVPAEVEATIRICELTLALWAQGLLNAKQVRDLMRENGVRLMGRLGASGGPWMDADVAGFGPVTLEF